MTTPSDDPREVFEHLSSEYAQALKAWDAIEKQAPTLLALGHSEDLRRFLDQFGEMAKRARDLALDKNETNFVDWFGELMSKAESLRDSVSDVN